MTEVASGSGMAVGTVVACVGIGVGSVVAGGAVVFCTVGGMVVGFGVGSGEAVVTGRAVVTVVTGAAVVAAGGCPEGIFSPLPAMPWDELPTVPAICG